MKLNEYLNFKNNHNNIIDLLKYEELIRKLSNNIQNGLLINNNNILDNLDKNNKIFLSSNPDWDFPNPRKEILNLTQEEVDKIPYIDRIENLNNKNIKIFCHSVGKLEDNINMVPIGRDWKNKIFFNKADNFNKKDKNILCYYNCTLPPDSYHWYSNPRKVILDILKEKKFCLINCRECPGRVNEKQKLDFLKKLAQSKFMVCPRGCGIDTYRIWDCIYLGCIPIIIKYEGYKQFEDLPILFLEDWEELKDIDEEFLNKKWIEMLEIDYNYDKLNLEYWKNKILNS